jgi:hypothetical protein
MQRDWGAIAEAARAELARLEQAGWILPGGQFNDERHRIEMRRLDIAVGIATVGTTLVALLGLAAIVIGG